MELLLSASVGILVAAAIYLMLSRSLLRFLFGLTLISNAANLLIFASGRLTAGAPPLIPEGAYAPVGDVANALPQALVLTAIVIGFGLFAFSLVLAIRAYSELGTLETSNMRLAEPRPDLRPDPSTATSNETSAG
ncbi:Na+/H+ antiporter subunit C [Pseudoruegeria sp. SK021]|uniref:Na+/H+ antiporter subunit C n=1 Tax=Pseudoruegeria sp. SK021 TaxID=1933035 RepID=UPI000A22AEEB|nr:Na+/H+ antiporter subunit C [Pseudoruegeria sp. SK021]OSP56823.1 cation:proton antiporter [Pseudoruegeria sp. SK021]